MYDNTDNVERKFVYFPINSISKEAIHSTRAYTELEAANVFASLKNLSVHDFLEIYTIEEREN